jgi:hypothetical protein
MRETAPSRLKNHLSEWQDFHIHIADLLDVQLNVTLIELLDKIRLGRWWTNGNVTPLP